MAEIKANTLDRYLIVITSNFFLAKIVINMYYSLTVTAVRKSNKSPQAARYEAALYREITSLVFMSHHSSS